MQIICICKLLCNNTNMNYEQDFKERLRAVSERVTSPRLILFRTLLRSAPLPMSKLISHASENGIDQVTVYRTMDLFRKMGLIQEVGLGRRRLFELSDTYHAHHHHFTCTKCGRVIDFDSDIIETELQRMSIEYGLKIHAHQLEVTGVCKVCNDV